jgi:hypothetical protein
MSSGRRQLFCSGVVQKLIVMRFHRSVALAGQTLEALEVNDLDVSAVVTDETGPL